MAPPKKKSDDLKNQRIPIMMTEAELKLIDDWSFANRIRSRGEAIRRLCQMGIIADQKKAALATDMNALATNVMDLSKKTRKANLENSAGIGDALDDAIIPFMETFIKVVELVEALNIISEGESASTSILEARDFMAKLARARGGNQT